MSKNGLQIFCGQTVGFVSWFLIPSGYVLVIALCCFWKLKRSLIIFEQLCVKLFSALPFSGSSIFYKYGHKIEFVTCLYTVHVCNIDIVENVCISIKHFFIIDLYTLGFVLFCFLNVVFFFIVLIYNNLIIFLSFYWCTFDERVLVHDLWVYCIMLCCEHCMCICILFIL